MVPEVLKYLSFTSGYYLSNLSPLYEKDLEISINCHHRSLHHALPRCIGDAQPVPARDACVLRRPGMRPWGNDDGDADAMATGRLDPDLYIHIYLFNNSFAYAVRLGGCA